MTGCDKELHPATPSGDARSNSIAMDRSVDNNMYLVVTGGVIDGAGHVGSCGLHQTQARFHSAQCAAVSLLHCNGAGRKGRTPSVASPVPAFGSVWKGGFGGFVLARHKLLDACAV